MAKPLLIHSLSELDEIILGLVTRCQPTSVLEIGSEHGGFSQSLYQRCKAIGASLDTIEPFPAPAVQELAKTADDFHLFVDRSLPHLMERGCRSQFVVIDGDHNWFTVYNELTLIAKSWAEWGTSGCIVLHDVPSDTGNIDHIVVASRGVYVVETKSFRKPPPSGNKQNEAAYQVRFDGSTLMFPDFMTRKPVEQVLRHADW